MCSSDLEIVRVPGALQFQSADGYRMDTSAVGVDLKARTIISDGAVTGQMPLGTFSAGSMRADLNARTVALTGRARLRIVQGAVRGR